MTLKEKFKEFDQIAPVEQATILGKQFPYRFYRNPDPKKDVTLLFLAGGTGLGDGFFYLYDLFAPNYSILSFNYSMGFPSIAAQTDAIALLIETIGAPNVYLCGQSFGGLLAQILAARHPEAIKGLILSGTCGVGQAKSKENQDFIAKMLDPKKIEKNIKTDRRLPIWLLSPMMKLACFKLIKDKAMRKDFKDIVDICRPSMSNEYFVLMDTLFGDLRNYIGMFGSESFLSFKRESLLVFSKEDTFFSESLKQELIELFENPVVEPDLKGGHLALMASKEKYVSLVNEFIAGRNPNYK